MCVFLYLQMSLRIVYNINNLIYSVWTLIFYVYMYNIGWSESNQRRKEKYKKKIAINNFILKHSDKYEYDRFNGSNF